MESEEKYLNYQTENNFRSTVLTSKPLLVTLYTMETEKLQTHL